MHLKQTEGDISDLSWRQGENVVHVQRCGVYFSKVEHFFSLSVWGVETSTQPSPDTGSITTSTVSPADKVRCYIHYTTGVHFLVNCGVCIYAITFTTGIWYVYDLSPRRLKRRKQRRESRSERVVLLVFLRLCKDATLPQRAPAVPLLTARSKSTAYTPAAWQ